MMRADGIASIRAAMGRLRPVACACAALILCAAVAVRAHAAWPRAEESRAEEPRVEEPRAEEPRAEEPRVIDFATLLRALADPRGERPEALGIESVSVQSSRDQGSIDRAEPTAWFSESDAGNVLRIDRVDGRSEWVLADLKGVGAIIRIVISSSVVIRDAVIRVRIDGEATPSIEWPLRDIAGKIAPEFAPFVVWHPTLTPPTTLAESIGQASGAIDCILPIPFARSCVVSLDRRPDLYRVESVAFSAGVRVERFIGDAARFAPGTELAALRDQASARVLARDPRPLTPTSLPPGGRIERVLEGSGVVRRLALQVDPLQASAAVRDLWIECDFDGVPTIRMPLGGFVGLGSHTGRSGDAFRTVGANGAMEFRLPMAFASGARIALVNRGAATLAGAIEVAERSARISAEPPHLLHGAWREHRRVVVDALVELELARIEGSGLLVGESCTQVSAVTTWLPTGDDRLVIDGRDELAGPSHTLVYGNAPLVPRHARGVLVSVPAQPQRWDSRGWSASRLRMFDAVPFTKSLVQSVEVLPAATAGCETSLAHSVLWYAQAGATRGVGFDDPAAMPPPAFPRNIAPLKDLFPPAAGEEWFEAEDLAVSFWSQGGNWAPEAVGLINPGHAWGGGVRVGLLAVEVGDAIELVIPARDDSPRRITGRFVRSVDAARIAVSVNGVRVPGEVVLGSIETVPSDLIDLGVHAPEEGRFLVRLTIAGLSEFARRRLHVAVDGFRTSRP